MHSLSKPRVSVGILVVAGLMVAPLVAGSTAVAVTSAPAPMAPADGAPDPQPRRVLTDEHVDAINVNLDDGELRIDSKIGPPIEQVPTDDLVFQLIDAGHIEGLPPQFQEFIGSDQAWIVPQTQDFQIVWAGWSTELIGTDVVDGDAVDITIGEVRGPGDVEVWQTGNFGSIQRIFSSDEDFTTLRQSVGAHVHANWAFTEPGVYTVPFTVSASVDGQTITSPEQDFTWVVGGEPHELPEPAVSVTTASVPAEAEPDQPVTLSATVGADTGTNAPPALAGHVEFLASETSLGWAEIVDGVASLETSFAEVGDYEVAARFVGDEPQFYAESVSAPVIISVGQDEPPVQTSLTIEGPTEPVAAGSEVTLTAVQDPPTGAEHYHWFVKPAGSDEFEVINGALAGSYSFGAEAALDGAQYHVVLYDHDHNAIAESPPYTLTVADDEPPAETTLTIDGPAEPVAAGSTVTLTAVQDPPSDLDEYQWFSRPSPGDAFSAIDGEVGPTYTLAADESLDGVQFYVELYGGPDGIAARSDVYTLTLQGTGPGPKPDKSPAPISEDLLIDATRGGITLSDEVVQPGADVTISGIPGADTWASIWLHSEPTDLGFSLTDADGATTTTIPADAPTGEHKVAVLTADGDLFGWAPLTVAPARCEDPRTVLTDEHVDLVSPRLTRDDLTLEAKLGTTDGPRYLDPADVLVQVKDPEAATSIPDLPEFGFLGEPGETVWVIPQTQNPEVVWAGWSTEELEPGVFEGDSVRVDVTEVEGPGEVEVFQESGFGTVERIFSSTADIEPLDQGIGAHVHANWAFTELGEYTMTFKVSGTLAGGEEITAGPVDYAFVVGEPECDEEPPGGESGTADGSDTGSAGGDTGGEDGTDSGTDDGSDGGDVGGHGGTDAGADDGTEGGGTDNGTDGGADAGGNRSPKQICVPTSHGTVPAGRGTGTPAPSAPTPTPPARPGGETVTLTNEHVDLLSPRLTGSTLTLQAKVGSAAEHTFHNPTDVIVQVNNHARTTIPDGDRYAFLGSSGDPVWLIPETQNPDVVWAGWSTEQLAPGALQGDEVRMRMVGAQGPGSVEVYGSAGFGDIRRIFSSQESLPPLEQAVGAHVHADWAFSAPGTYTVTFEVSGTLADGQNVTTGDVSYTFAVGDGATTNGASASGLGTLSTAAWAGPLTSAPTFNSAATAPAPTATPSPTPTVAPTAAPSPTTSAKADDCDALARTGGDGVGLLSLAGLLAVGSGAVMAITRRRRSRAVG